MEDDSLEFDGHVEARTDLAVLFYVEDDGEEHWFPISVCELDSSETSILVPLWLAKKRGLA